MTPRNGRLQGTPPYIHPSLAIQLVVLRTVGWNRRFPHSGEVPIYPDVRTRFSTPGMSRSHGTVFLYRGHLSCHVLATISYYTVRIDRPV